VASALAPRCARKRTTLEAEEPIPSGWGLVDEDVEPSARRARARLLAAVTERPHRERKEPCSLCDHVSELAGADAYVSTALGLSFKAYSIMSAWSGVRRERSSL
jgi:hypothetical protein